MSRLLQSASVLTLVAAFAAVPVVATAQQQTESEAEQAVESVVQETQEAAGEAAQETGEAAGEAVQVIEQTTEEAGQALDQAGEAVEQTTEQAGQAVEQTTEQAGQAVEQTTEEAGQAVEVTTEGAGETKEIEAEIVEDEEVVEPTAQEGEATGEAAVVAVETPVEEVQGTIVLQDDNSMLTSDLLDAAVYNSAGEKVGDIDDAILSLDGTVEGVVIGVGGFLGIGEKHVAVEMQQISVQTNETGEPQLILDTTREALEAAPEFQTVEDQQAGMAAEQQAAGGMAPTPTGAVPAEEPAAPTTSN